MGLCWESRYWFVLVAFRKGSESGNEVKGEEKPKKIDSFSLQLCWGSWFPRARNHVAFYWQEISYSAFITYSNRSLRKNLRKRELIDFHKSLIERNLSCIALGTVILWLSDILISRLCKLITHRLSLLIFGYILLSLHYVWTYCYNNWAAF